MHSLAKNSQEFDIINQLFETKERSISLSYYSSYRKSVGKLAMWVFSGGQGQTCWERYPQWTSPSAASPSITIQDPLPYHRTACSEMRGLPL